MRFVLINDSESREMMQVFNGLENMTERDFVILCDKIGKRDPRPSDCALVFVNDLTSLSSSFTLLRMLIEDRLHRLMIITIYDLATPLKLADRWEQGRFDELISQHQLIICDARQDWRTAMSEFILQSKGG